MQSLELPLRRFGILNIVLREQQNRYSANKVLTLGGTTEQRWVEHRCRLRVALHGYLARVLDYEQLERGMASIYLLLGAAAVLKRTLTLMDARWQGVAAARWAPGQVARVLDCNRRRRFAPSLTPGTPL